MILSYLDETSNDLKLNSEFQCASVGGLLAHWVGDSRMYSRPQVQDGGVGALKLDFVVHIKIKKKKSTTFRKRGRGFSPTSCSRPRGREQDVGLKKQ